MIVNPRSIRVSPCSAVLRTTIRLASWGPPTYSNVSTHAVGTQDPLDLAMPAWASAVKLQQAPRTKRKGIARTGTSYNLTWSR